jgi:hypothetical protein
MWGFFLTLTDAAPGADSYMYQHEEKMQDERCAYYRKA